ncbi:hypothetical protein Tco_0187680 [Tanacetum coccineum]
MTVDDLLQLVPQLMTRVDSLEKDLKQKLVKKVKKLEGLVTPSKTTVNASGEEQVKDISPTTLEAAKTLSRVASQKPKSIDKGMSIKVNTVSGQVSIDITKRSIPSLDKGQREGKPPMIIEEAPKKTKEQLL